MHIEEFLEKRQVLLSGYERLKELAGRLENAAMVREIEETMQLLQQDVFKIVVVGEFSRGKSTFINALLGKRVLPAATRPTTAIINRISYGEEKRFVIHFRDNDKVREVTEEEFKNIKAPSEVEEDSAAALAAYTALSTAMGRIAYAEIAYPLEVCRNGIELIDTPGTNDLDQVREEITFSFIPEADAAIMLLSAEQILSRSEMDFLKERILKNDIQKIFFVINFKDRLESDDDGRRICQTAAAELSQVVTKPRVFLVSAKAALNKRRHDQGEAVKGIVPETLEESGFVEFEQSLSDYLVWEKGDGKLQKYVLRAQRLGKDLLDQTISLRQANLGRSREDIERDIALLQPRLQKTREASHRIFANTKDCLRLVAEDYSRQYRRGLERISRQAVMTVNSYTGELDSASIARAVESAMAPMQQEHEGRIRRELDESIATEFTKAEGRLQRLFQDESMAMSKELVLVPSDGSNQATAMALQVVPGGEEVLLGGGLAFGTLLVAAHLPFIAIPAVIFGGACFMQMFGKYRRADFLMRASEQVRQRYEQIIPEQSAGFQRELNQRLDGQVDSLDAMIDGKLTAIEEQLQSLLRHKEEACQHEEEEAAFLLKSTQAIESMQHQWQALLPR